MKHVSISMHNVRILPMCIYIYININTYVDTGITLYEYHRVYIYVYICIFNAHVYTVAKPMTQTTASI